MSPARRRRGRLVVVGTGPGPGYLTPRAQELLRTCEVFVGGARRLARHRPGASTCPSPVPWPTPIATVGDRLDGGRDVCVLTSGDPGYFSMLAALERAFPGEAVVEPGVASVQLLAARVGVPWQELTHLSVHGRDLALDPPPIGPSPSSAAARTRRRRWRRTWSERVRRADGRGRPPGARRRAGDRRVTPARPRPGSSARRRWSLRGAEGLAGAGGLDVRARRSARGPRCGRPTTRRRCGAATAPGIPEEAFVRARAGAAVSLGGAGGARGGRPAGRAPGHLGRGRRQWRLRRRTRVAEPSRPRGGVRARPAELPRADAERGRASAPAWKWCRARLPATFADPAAAQPPDLVVVGGSGGRLEDVLDAGRRALAPGGRVVVTAVTLDTAGAASRVLARRAVGRLRRAAALLGPLWNGPASCRGMNPITILWADRGRASTTVRPRAPTIRRRAAIAARLEATSGGLRERSSPTIGAPSTRSVWGPETPAW